MNDSTPVIGSSFNRGFPEAMKYVKGSPAAGRRVYTTAAR
jgi:hypothetical protein